MTRHCTLLSPGLYPVESVIVPCLLFVFTALCSAGELDFNRDIRPILSDKCFFCHGPDSHERKADLRLDTPDGAKSVITAGKPGESEAMARILDKEDPMPPLDSHKSLTKKEIDLISRWIKEGAEFEDYWAYVPPVKHDFPAVSDNDWPLNWIDHFILYRLGQEGLSPSPEADKTTIIRRLYFDLIGLPPTPQQADDFLSGRKSYINVVDELLASPHFGERMAMYWLDLVRYADTVGYHGDQDHNISPYRDYVIRSFNRNLPFDQFTIEQLAGDLLEQPDKWQSVASGYNRLLQTSHEGGIQAKEYNAIYAADRVRNVSAVWMGATVGCAQCHDHKYDPYTIKDHYSLAAYFADIHDDGYNGNALPTNRPPEMIFLSDQLESDLAVIRAKMEDLAGTEIQPEIEKYITNRTALEKSLLVGKKSKKAVEKQLKEIELEIENRFPENKKAAWRNLRSKEKQILNSGRRTMITSAEPPRTMRVLPRGNWQDDSGETVRPGVPEFLGSIPGHTRLDLARWLTDPENGVGGLTARVFANRFWYLFFGTGISSSLADFGGQGQPPVNPELLDNLAVFFYENGWDSKAMVKLLVTSRAYRQSSIASPELLARDPYNQLVARQSRYRLPAEVIRDNALAVSNLLIKETGGTSVKPYQPAGYYRHLNFPKRQYKNHDDKRQWRRGVYVHWQRMFLHPMMKAMDAPSREECTAERPRSNTPNAALVLLNDPTFVEAARVLAQRILIEGGSNFDDRLEFAYQAVLNRPPDTGEKSVFQSLLEKTGNTYLKSPETADQLIATGLSPTPPDLDPVELASWTAVARGLINLNETITRN
ncbi:MAG: PSD1 and planctomycete cytochrome C domain-containing protein [Verrucomicrobiales bacterium]|nr:PSD1 and planctomycete cytochrome C domain-containing protein [Verrucomicrobiales bacterium]